MCTAAAENYAGILVIRFILGMFEAAIPPSAMNIVAMWYTRDEAPFRMCLVLGCNGLAAMVSALLSYGVRHVADASVAQERKAVAHFFAAVLGISKLGWFCCAEAAHIELNIR